MPPDPIPAPDAAQEAPARRSWGVASRLLAAMLVVAILPSTLVAMATFDRRAEQLRSTALEQLTALANTQEARVTAFVEASRSTAGLIASRTQLRRNVAQLIDGDSTVAADVARILDDARTSTSGIDWVGIVAPDGGLLASSGAGPAGDPTVLVQRLDLADADASAWQVARAGAEVALSLAIPASLDGRVLGAVVVRLDLQPLVDLARDHEGLGATGETFLAQRSADGSAQFITPLRFDDDAQLRATVDADATDVPITVALDRREQVLEDGIDYRGEYVFAATRYLPGVDWGLVVKIDRAEALAAIASLRGLLVAAGALSMLLAALVAVVLSRSLTRPLEDLEAVVRDTEAGDLTRRADTAAPGEIGALAASFNRMADAVGQSHEQLEQRVARRTRALERSVRELEHRNEELDAFASVVAHDLRSPLAVIVGVVEAISAGLVTDPDKVAALLESARHSGVRMDELIGDLLELARAGSRSLDTSAVILDDLVADVVAAMDLGDVVAVGPLPAVSGDARGLGQVFQNLIGNAAKYTAPDVDPQVVVAAEQVDDLWVITIDDNGVGIPEDERHAVFEPFRRGSSTDDKAGTGVGLAIVARVVAHHGGKVSASTSDLGGTRMLVTLPVHLSGPVDGPPGR